MKQETNLPKAQTTINVIQVWALLVRETGRFRCCWPLCVLGIVGVGFHVGVVVAMSDVALLMVVMVKVLLSR